jgi:transcriptional regulator with XRE-family HTH domain
MMNGNDVNEPAGLRLFFKEWRDWAGLTQEELARRMGELVATVRRVENGERSGLRYSYLEKFVRIVGCPNPWDPLAGPPGPLPETYHLLRSLEPEQQQHARRLIETFSHGSS